MAIYNAGARFAQVGASVAERANQNIKDRDRVQAEAAEFKLRKNVANAQNTPENIELQMEALQAQNQQLAAKQAKQATYDALERYTGDWKPNHINQLLQEEPAVRKAFGNPVSIERIDPSVDAALLAQFGVKPEDFNPKIHLKAIGEDGKPTLFNFTEMGIGTGFFKRMRHEKLDLLIKENQLFGKADKDRLGTAGELEKNAKYLADQGVEDGVEATIANNLYLDKIAGNTVGQQMQADKAITELFAAFGGEDEFFNTNITTNRSNRVKAERYVRRLEEYGNVKLSAPDRADLKDINTLITTANIASDKITPDVTGAFDTLYRDVGKYISNEVASEDQVAASSAYAAFRNTTRHALFGATLTQGEIDSFNQAFGTLRQKYPAVMTQFKTALMQTRSKLQTIYELNNPILAHYYMGKNAGDLDKIIRSIDERLELFDQTGSPVASEDSVPGAEVEKPSMESILGPRTE